MRDLQRQHGSDIEGPERAAFTGHRGSRVAMSMTDPQRTEQDNAGPLHKVTQRTQRCLLVHTRAQSWEQPHCRCLFNQADGFMAGVRLKDHSGSGLIKVGRIHREDRQHRMFPYRRMWLLMFYIDHRL